MSQALHTLDPELVAAALQNVMSDRQGLTPLAVGLECGVIWDLGSHLVDIGLWTTGWGDVDRVMESTPYPLVTLDATMPVDELAGKAFNALQHYNVHLASG